ncbi:MAG TPA: CapA family protein [Bacteroidales bacterium]|nr:CapA family protein [Bacteroidales bacterium]
MRFLKTSLFLVALLLPRLSDGQEADSLPAVPPAGQEADSVLTIMFTGDIMGHDGQILSAYDDSAGTYSYDSVFRYVSPLLSAADIAIGNLEVTLGGKPYKGYPAFSSPDALAQACRDAGFDILTTANNHAADRGPKGITRTIRVLDSLSIRHTGTWVNSEARDTLSPLMITAKGITLALLSYTYGTNGIVVPPPAIVSYIDTVRIGNDIKSSAERGADLVIVSVHWGTEYDTLPSAEQKLLADAMFRSGADIIIGSHPHVIQPMTASVDSTGLIRPVVWSMGNFVSNQRQQRRDGGAMICLELTRRGDRVFITEAGYILTWVYTPSESGKRRFFILPCSEYEYNAEFFRSSSDYNSMMIFVSNARRLLNSQNTGFGEVISAFDMWTDQIK